MMMVYGRCVSTAFEALIVAQEHFLREATIESDNEKRTKLIATARVFWEKACNLTISQSSAPAITMYPIITKNCGVGAAFFIDYDDDDDLQEVHRWIMQTLNER